MLRAADVDAIVVAHRPAVHRGAAALLPHAGAPAVSGMLMRRWPELHGARAASGTACRVATRRRDVGAVARRLGAATPTPPSRPPRSRSRPASSRRRVTIGTPFRYTVEVQRPRDVEVVVPQPAERIGDFDDRRLRRRAAGASATARTVVDALVHARRLRARATHLIPSPAVQLPRRRASELQRGAARPTRVVMVASVLARAPTTPTDIRDIKAPEAVPPTGGRCCLVGAARSRAARRWSLVLYRLLQPRRRARRRAAAAAGARGRRWRRSARCAPRRLLEAGAFKEYYSRALGDRAHATSRSASACARRR